MKVEAASFIDPKDWEEVRRIGHRAFDDMLDYLRDISNRPAWQPVPERVKQALREPIPSVAQPLDNVYREFLEYVMPYPTGNIHPRFWGWVMGTGSPIGMIADMLASGMNAHVAGFDQSATEIEHTVLRWLAEMCGLPADTSGVLVSGGTAANLIGLTVARHAKSGVNIRQDGVPENRLVLYGSEETHSWASRSCELLGLGRKALRLIPVDRGDQIRLDLLKQAIASDRQKGLRPMCVIGNAGTVNTGATDNLDSLADICAAERMWFHIDGAFGALTNLSPALRHIVKGMHRADSVAFDLHKWGYLPYDIGCILVRDADTHRSAFASTPHYLATLSDGIAKEPLIFAELGIQLSRSFRALKVWMALKAQGLDAWTKAIETNVMQAQYLEALIRRNDELELLAPVALNVVCFRFKADSRDLNTLNREILVRLQLSGVAVPSSTLIRGRFAIRVAITNHRSSFSDFDLLVNAVLTEGRGLVNKGASG